MTRSVAPPVRPSISQEWLFGLLLTLPVIVLVLGLIMYPGILAIYLSLTHKLIGYREKFVGLANYVDLWQDPMFRRALWNTFLFTTVSCAVKLVLGTQMAVTLNAGIRAKNFFTGFLLLPWVTPTVVSALNFLWMFDALLGVVNYILMHTGLMHQPIGWLSNPRTAMATVIFSNIWRGFPFFGVTLLAGLQTIPRELYEAAAVDGANRGRQFLHITIPGLMHVILVTTLLSIIWTFNDFQAVFVLTHGGPGGATHIVGTLSYETAIDGLNLGKGTAVSVFGFPVLLLVILWFVRHSRRQEAEA